MGLMLSLREVITRTIDSTPTEYRGVEMRSKLEADFAHYLDSKGIKWTYEPQLFGPQGGRYLPDFLLLEGVERTYVELKPTLEQAAGAMRRIELIWDTRPEAILVVVSGEDNRWYARVRGGEWETWQEGWPHS